MVVRGRRDPPERRVAGARDPRAAARHLDVDRPPGDADRAGDVRGHHRGSGRRVAARPRAGRAGRGRGRGRRAGPCPRPASTAASAPPAAADAATTATARETRRAGGGAARRPRSPTRRRAPGRRGPPRARDGPPGGGQGSGAQVAGRRRPSLGLLGQRPRDDVVEGGGHAGAAREGCGRRRVQVRPEPRLVGLARIGHLPREREVQHAAERVDVGAPVDALAADLLGRHEVQRARPSPRAP